MKKINKEKKINVKLTDEALKTIAYHCNGDVRSAINVIDNIVKFYKNEKVDNKLLQKILLSPTVLASSYGDEYYDMLSAFHKSLRGSDPDAGLYYLARLLTTGDLTSITRRMVACAYEDIGLANAPLCARVVTAKQAGYWGQIVNQGWGISDLCGYLQSGMNYKVAVQSLPLMIQQNLFKQKITFPLM